jgi:hypothetical protein
MEEASIAHRREAFCGKPSANELDPGARNAGKKEHIDRDPVFCPGKSRLPVHPGILPIDLLVPGPQCGSSPG